MASRSMVRRSGAVAILAVIVVALVGGCSSVSGPTTGTTGGGGAGGGGTSGGGGTTVADACALLTPADIQSTVGHAVTKTTPFQQTGQVGCTWEWPSDTGTDNVSLTVVSPGGKADFDSTRTFDMKFLGGFASLGAAAASLAAPIDSGLGQAAGNLFQVGDLAGIGDAAFMGPGVTVYAVKGDTEIQLQILDVTDTGIPDRTVQLVKTILGRL